MPAKNRPHSARRGQMKAPTKPPAPVNIENKPLESIREMPPTIQPWSPSPYTAFKALLSARLCAALWSNISDCDEVFNYWEPTHFLLYGSGFQTWEYSPLYAIRSYAYLLLYAVPGFIYSTIFQSNKLMVFYFTRCLLGFVSACCEVCFYRCICHRFGGHIGRLTLLFLLFGSGMFISSTAFLPSTFSMYLSMVALGAWFVMEKEIVVLATAASTILGWPFAIALSFPAAVDIVFMKKSFQLFVRWSLISLGLILIPSVMIDTHYFGKFVMAPMNIILYNVFTSHGPDLYGTEPWTFYFMNGFLNFNVCFVAALLSLPVVVFCSFLLKEKVPSSYMLPLFPLYLWIIIFFIQAHKEERFLFPMYPLICLTASITLDSVQRLVSCVFNKTVVDYLQSTNWIGLGFCCIYTVLCISRTVMTYRAYGAPMETFLELSRQSLNEDVHPLPSDYPVNLCMGKEWYRFPSSFFLPPNWNLQFLKSEFRGQLPKPYSNLPNATKTIPSAMNDRNLEEPSRYVNTEQCDYLVDSDFPSDSTLEPLYSKDGNWESISSIAFLDTLRSPRLLRAFYIPYLSDYKCTYVDYHLLQNKKIRERVAKKRRRIPTF